MEKLYTHLIPEAYESLMTEIDKLDKNDKQEFTEELNRVCAQYTQARAQEGYTDEDENRTSKHNVVIITYNMLEKVIEQNGGDNHWRNLIGRDTVGEERKVQGDFANYVTYRSAISNR